MFVKIYVSVEEFDCPIPTTILYCDSSLIQINSIQSRSNMIECHEVNHIIEMSSFRLKNSKKIAWQEIGEISLEPVFFSWIYLEYFAEP